MSTKCAKPDCTYLAVSGEIFCIKHRPEKVKLPGDGEAYAFVPMTDVPSNARYNEAAGKLFAAVKQCPDGQAIKLNMNVFKKPTLLIAQRYALAAGLRIGVRIVGENGYIWKMTEAELAKAKVKAERLVGVRLRKGKGKVTRATA